MELIELNAKVREGKGKGAARKLRAAKAIPAIVYGGKAEPVMLSVDAAAFDKVIREHGTGGHFFDLKIEGMENKMVLLKDTQMDAFSLNYIHIDFLEIDMNEKVAVTVPVEVEGVSKGVKDGGLLQIIRRDLDILCTPKDTPESIILNISDLDIGDSIHVEDIELGDAIEISYETNFTIVTIIPPETSSDDDAEEAEEGAAAAAAE